MTPHGLELKLTFIAYGIEFRKILGIGLVSTFSRSRDLKMRVGYYSCFFVWQGSAVVIFGQEYAAQDRLDISTNKLLQAFNLLLEDSGSARNQSMFSEQLAVAALNALRSVPEACKGLVKEFETRLFYITRISCQRKDSEGLRHCFIQ